VAVITALFAAMLSIGLGLSIVLLGSAETTLAAHDRDVRALAYASRGVGAVAVSELRALPSITLVGRAGVSPEVSATPGNFVDPTLTASAPWGGSALDLRAMTSAIQAEADGAVPAGGPRPVWRLFVYGNLERLVPGSGAAMPCYGVAWVADAGGLLLVRAAAFGAGEARALIELSLLPHSDPADSGRAALLRLVAVRPDP
jgi:hypothetical protein